MTGDYNARTLRAYEANPQKYEEATAHMVPVEEINFFVQQLPDATKDVLDAGCAFGRDTANFAERGLHVLGIDMSDALLERARQLRPELTFKKMDVRKLRLNDRSIAGIWCHATLLHLKNEDIVAALNEFYRVLVPQGILFMSFKEGVGDEEFVEQFSSDSARYFNYQTVDSVRQLAERAGFIVTKLYAINERERWGADKRDLNWVYCFAQKSAD